MVEDVRWDEVAELQTIFIQELEIAPLASLRRRIRTSHMEQMNLAFALVNHLR
ncbi:MAG: hypothetical protein WB392_11550 [Methanotrichaceae archaeon]